MSTELEDLEMLSGELENFLQQTRLSSELIRPISHAVTLPTTAQDRLQAALELNLESSLRIMKFLTSSTLGECRKEQPFTPLRPIIDEDGELMWCCTHTPPHCAK